MTSPSPSPQRFYLLLGLLAAAGVVALGVMVVRRKPVSIPANVTIQPSDTSGFHGYLYGPDSARITVTEYADYECPACQQWVVVQFPTIEERLIRTGKVRWRYRDFPLDQHRHARVAAHAAACADDQGRFWEMNQRIYSWQPYWPKEREASGTFRDMARAIGLDLDRYDDCMASAKYAGRIEAGRREGMEVGVQSTPTFLINGRLYAGTRDVHYDMLKAMVDSLEQAGRR